MGTASFHFDAWGAAWSDFLKKFAPACSRLDCRQTRTAWRRYRRKSRGVVIQGLRYCLEECMERALRDAVDRLDLVAKRVSAPHRIPLGLLLLSRQQLTADQLRAASGSGCRRSASPASSRSRMLWPGNGRARCCGQTPGVEELSCTLLS
jgi:hypothetical protein